MRPSKEVDIEIRFGIRNFIDRKEDKAYCFLCFVEFAKDDCDKHINSEFHLTLGKITEKLKDEEFIGKFCDNSKSEVTSSLSDEALQVSKESVDLKDYAKQNDIRYNNENKQALCELCNVHICGNFENITEHVNGSAHKKMKFKKDRKKTLNESVLYKTKPFGEYHEAIGIVIREGSVSGVIVNRKIFIAANAYALLKKYNMIKPKTLFQCGVCNEYCSSWSQMQQHLETSQHRAAQRESVKQARNLIRREMGPANLQEELLANMFTRSF